MKLKAYKISLELFCINRIILLLLLSLHYKENYIIKTIYFSLQLQFFILKVNFVDFR